MNSGVSMLRILFLLDVGGAQVLATGKPPGAEIDFRYALIGTAVGVAISAGFLALKICMIRRHLFDDDSCDLKSTPGGLNDTIPLKKRAPRAHVLRDGPALGPLHLLFSVIGMLFARKLQASPLFSFKSLLQCHHCIIEGLFKAKPQFLQKHLARSVQIHQLQKVRSFPKYAY
ncbi:transmembrane protein 273 isoform X1 [Hylobates moloch]|uniref:transmembrane protein 273 isoform X1 n=1 Tax=Hylobates moloch TaxID=81572 RepID=UPI001363FC88|nr:transmembrane protein 273 isoform X1 [Hylobates moloch]